MADSDSIWGVVKRNFTSFEDYCYRKLAEEAIESTNFAREMTARTLDHLKYEPETYKEELHYS